MARVTKAMIDRAAEINAQMNALKKELDAIKSDLKAKGAGEQEGNNYVAVVKIRETSNLNQDKAVAKAKALGAKWLVKKIEQVDEDMLEDDIAKGTLKADDFIDCLDIRTTSVLTFKTKKKKGKK